MIDRLILWLVCLSPLLLMLATIFSTRWRKISRSRVRKEAFLSLIAVMGVSAIVAWDVIGVRVSAAKVHVQNPMLLLALIPLLGLLLWVQTWTLSGIARGRMWTAFLLRGAILILLLLALAGLQMVVEQDTLTVIYALDVSKSVPISERARAIDFIKKALPGKRADDKTGLLVFGGKPEWEVAPTTMFAAPDSKRIKAIADPDATNIEGAMRRALTTANDDARKRLVLFTDGRQNVGDAETQLKRLVSMGTDVWIVPLNSGKDPEMLIEKVEIPSQLLWEQTFDARVLVRGNISAKARVKLYTGEGHDPEPQEVDLVPGQKIPVTFRGLRLHTGGAKEIRAVLEPLHRDDDTLTENNEAYAFTDVQTESRILVLTSDMSQVSHLLSALEGEKLTLDVRAGASLPDNPEDYRAYDCIVLANIARGAFSEQQMKVIQSCVKEQGAGLVMIGGDQSFGAGGYLNTPIEDALPVQMDLQNKRVMPSGALCIVLHTCEFADGNAWGKKISKAAIKTLSPQDYAGLIYYGNMGGEQWCFKPRPVIPKMFEFIDGCDPGDMPSLDTIISMAVKSLDNLSNVSLKHCIIITDGDPAKPTAATINAAKKGQITISTISICPHQMYDISELKDIATQTGGSYYATNNPKTLPQIFIKEAAVVRKSLIRSDEKGIPVNLGVTGPTLKEFGTKFPSVFAFVVTQAKQLAELQLYTTVEGEKIPILMSWHYGLGKSVAFTSDCTNNWGAEWVKWQSYRKFWINLLTWVSRQRMPSNHTVTTKVEGDTAHVYVEGLTEKGDYINFAKLTGNVTDPDVTRNGPDARIYDLNFTMTAPGRYEATFPVTKAGAYSITVMDQSDPRKPSAIVTGLANSYSPEFSFLEGDDVLLTKLGEIATGKSPVNHLKDLQKLDPLKSNVYAHDLPPTRQPEDLFWRLIVAAIVLFPLDVAVRRLALDPEVMALWLWSFASPVVSRLRRKQQELQEAAAEAIAGRPAAGAPPPDIVPTGAQSREAQSRYEQLGAKSDFNLNADPNAAENKPAVGGTKISEADPAASDYTRALLKAKKRAKKDE